MVANTVRVAAQEVALHKAIFNDVTVLTKVVNFARYAWVTITDRLKGRPPISLLVVERSFTLTGGKVISEYIPVLNSGQRLEKSDMLFPPNLLRLWIYP
jgi:hypothetical protein